MRVLQLALTPGEFLETKASNMTLIIAYLDLETAPEGCGGTRPLLPRHPFLLSVDVEEAHPLPHLSKKGPRCLLLSCFFYFPQSVNGNRNLMCEPYVVNQQLCIQG